MKELDELEKAYLDLEQFHESELKLVDYNGHELIRGARSSLMNHISQKKIYTYGNDGSKTILQYNNDCSGYITGHIDTYDNNGRLIKSRVQWQDEDVYYYYYNSNGLLESMTCNSEYNTEYFYNKNQSLIRVENSEYDSFIKEMVVNGHEDHIYNTSGKIIKSICIGNWQEIITEMKHDIKGNIITGRKTTRGFIGNSLNEIIEMNYDVNGNLIAEIHKNDNDVVKQMVYYIYNSNKKLELKIQADKDGHIQSKSEFMYDINSNLISQYDYGENGLINYIKNVYQNNLIVYKEIIGNEGRKVFTYSYKYDSEGRLIEETELLEAARNSWFIFSRVDYDKLTDELPF